MTPQQNKQQSLTGTCFLKLIIFQNEFLQEQRKYSRENRLVKLHSFGKYLDVALLTLTLKLNESLLEKTCDQGRQIRYKPWLRSYKRWRDPFGEIALSMNGITKTLISLRSCEADLRRYISHICTKKVFSYRS